MPENLKSDEAECVEGGVSSTPSVDREKFNRLVAAKHGQLLVNKNDIYIGRSIQEYGEFSELEVETLLKICRSGDVVVEVGANIGAHTVPLARKVGNRGRVYAFEPLRVVFQTLCANCALNSLVNVDCRNLALGEESSELSMGDLDYQIKNNFGGIGLDRLKRSGPRGVNRIRIERLDEMLDIPRLRLLKIDVEGMEASVIRGATGLIEKFHPVIYCENDNNEKSPELLRLLFDFGYRIWWHFPPMFNKDNFFGNSKNVFGNTVSGNVLCVHRSVKLNLHGAIEATDPDFHPMYPGKP